MKILAINGTVRKKGTATGLTEAALEGRHRLVPTLKWLCYKTTMYATTPTASCATKTCAVGSYKQKAAPASSTVAGLKP